VYRGIDFSDILSHTELLSGHMRLFRKIKEGAWCLLGKSQIKFRYYHSFFRRNIIKKIKGRAHKAVEPNPAPGTRDEVSA